jgi:hypothetical protein
MRRILDFLRLDDVPRFSRPAFLAEVRHVSLWGIVAGAVEASIVSIVASKTFGAPELLTSFIFATPVLINLLNVLWSVMVRGRPRVPMFLVLASGALIAVCSIGLTNAAWQPWAAWVFAGQVALVHLFLSGLVTLRTTMWMVNYPYVCRARMAGRIQTLVQLLTLLTAAGLSIVFDQSPGYYRIVYPGVALLGLLSLWPIRRMHMRREKAELRRFREHLARQASHNGGRAGLWSGVKESFAILRDDRDYAKYMLAQFLLGSANFFTDPILVNILARRLNFTYFHSTLLLHTVPVIMLLVSIRFWARYFDYGGVLRFRIYNSACWVASYVGVMLAVLIIGRSPHGGLIPAVAVLVVGRVFNGVARGGGDIAWNIGHLHFAREHQTELYMGIHVALTGLRGLIMPLLGWWANYYLDWGSFAIALALALASLVMFRRQAATDTRMPRP